MIGILQVPAVTVVSDIIGGSRGYVTVAAQWLHINKETLKKYFK